MYARIPLLLLACTLGCADEKADSGEAEAAPCTVLTSGDWLLKGTSIGHDMFGTLDFDEDSCSFALSDWNMNMDIATGGAVDGDTIRFIGDGADRDWSLCSGTVHSETSASAQCSDDTATITMDFDG
jgi:hypothetical protein